jgi:hypothetical protein
MSDFISGFFSWGKSKKVEEPLVIIEEKEVKELPISIKRFRKPPKLEEE